MTRHHLTCVDADACAQSERRHGGPHLPSSPDRPQRVVLVRDRHPEDGHHRVADELLDRAAMALEDRAHPLVVAAHRRPERLGIGDAAERGRPGQVAEDDGDDLAHLARGRLLRERSPAAAAEPEPGRILPPTRVALHLANVPRMRSGSGCVQGEPGELERPEHTRAVAERRRDDVPGDLVAELGRVEVPAGQLRDCQILVCTKFRTDPASSLSLSIGGDSEAIASRGTDGAGLSRQHERSGTRRVPCGLPLEAPRSFARPHIEHRLLSDHVPPRPRPAPERARDRRARRRSRLWRRAGPRRGTGRCVCVRSAVARQRGSGRPTASAQ